MHGRPQKNQGIANLKPLWALWFSVRATLILWGPSVRAESPVAYLDQFLGKIGSM